LAFASSSKTYKKYEPVCLVNDPSNHVFFVLDGKIGVFGGSRKTAYNEDDISKMLGSISPGCVFGEIGVIRGDIR